MRTYSKTAATSREDHIHHVKLDDNGQYTHTFVGAGNRPFAQARLAPMRWHSDGSGPVYRVAELSLQPSVDGDVNSALARGRALFEAIQSKHPAAHILYATKDQAFGGSGSQAELARHTAAMGFRSYAEDPDWFFLHPTSRGRGKTAALRDLGLA